MQDFVFLFSILRKRVNDDIVNKFKKVIIAILKRKNDINEVIKIKIPRNTQD